MKDFNLGLLGDAGVAPGRGTGEGTAGSMAMELTGMVYIVHIFIPYENIASLRAAGVAPIPPKCLNHIPPRPTRRTFCASQEIQQTGSRQVVADPLTACNH